MLLNEATLKVIAGNNNFKDKELLKDLTELFYDKPEACVFLNLYGQLAEIVDDNIDEPKSVERIQQQTKLSAQISIDPYWQKNYYALWAVERLVNNTCFDSVRWEKADEEWKRRDAKCLSHASYMILFAVILIEFGEDTLTALSLRFREHAHERHLNDTI